MLYCQMLTHSAQMSTFWRVSRYRPPNFMLPDWLKRKGFPWLSSCFQTIHLPSAIQIIRQWCKVVVLN